MTYPRHTTQPSTEARPAKGFRRETPFSVGLLTSNVKSLLENQFPRIWVVGEISNFKAAGSGHWYFSLKDDAAQIRANMWRSQTRSVPFRPKDGMEVLVSGSLSVYPPRGDYSIIVDRMEELGEGRLRAEFERLKAQLQKEGLFEPSVKLPLPFLPQKIGLVTSHTGAALRDMLRVLQQRFDGLSILIHPARVQGQGAASEIAAGIRYLDQHGACDVLVVGRGGGSIEDLWAFNEEVVARAIFASKTPIISAVGHETDYTIADFVADVRAATPSNAAELAVKSKSEYRQLVNVRLKTMERGMQHRLLRLRNRIMVSESHPIFIRVRARLNTLQRHLADLDYRCGKKLQVRLEQLRQRLERLDRGLSPHALKANLANQAHRLERMRQALDLRIASKLEQGNRQAALLTARLDDLSPLKILGRGYAVVSDAKQRPIINPDQVSFGDLVDIRVHEGSFKARVVEDTGAQYQPDLFESE